MMDLLVRFAEHGLIHGDLNEFNTMVNEDQKLFVLDFPQMVSVYHKDAEFYFERDQKCVQVLFKRRYDFVSNRSHKLSEIQVGRRLDEEVKNIKFWQEQTKEDQAVIEGYMKERGAEQEDYETEEMGEEAEEDKDQADELGEIGEEPLQDDAPNEELDQEATELGDIEAELKLLGVETKPEAPVKVEIEAEEMTWEQLLDHRDKMKELKKQAKQEKLSQAERRAKEQLEAMKTPIAAESKAPEKDKESEDSSSNESEAEDYIKKAVKKGLRKKKTQKATKNHPKQQGQLLRNAL